MPYSLVFNLSTCDLRGTFSASGMALLLYAPIATCGSPSVPLIMPLCKDLLKASLLGILYECSEAGASVLTVMSSVPGT